MNTSLPSASMLTLPWLGSFSCGLLTVSSLLSLSTSLSLAFTSMVTGVLMAVVATSSFATGASFTGVTSITWLAVAVVVPSLISYGKVTVPLKFSAGLKVITPAASMLTMPFGTLIVCTPPLNGSPLIDTMPSWSPLTSVSLLSGVSIKVPSSAMV